MKSPLGYPTFRTLFTAQICSLVAIGLLTVALALAAYQIGGNTAGGKVLASLLALKMIAYVLLAPVAETLLAGRSRKPVMITLDLLRLALLIPMAFVTDFWQLAMLAFMFFAISSAFTPLFQSVIPDLFPDDDTYSKALAYSRIAYTLETVSSPILAAAVLHFASAEDLFLLAALAFLGSIFALLATRFPRLTHTRRTGTFLKRATRGVTIYWRTPRLRGLFLLNLALSLAMGWVLVNTVVYAGLRLGDAEYYYPILMTAFGLGATAGAILVPRLVRAFAERWVIICGALAFATLGGGILLPPHIIGLTMLWAGLGLTSSLVITPGGLVIARSAERTDLAAVFAAQFSLSHAGWLIAYPLAGWLATWISLEGALIVLSGLCVITVLLAMYIWPADDPVERQHDHPELEPTHPHLRDIACSGAEHRHQHAFFIDDIHTVWNR
jgi:MFS family permease